MSLKPCKSLRRAAAACVALGLMSAALQGPASAAPYLGSFGLDEASIDRSIAPGDNFAGFVNGKWYASAKIPADRAWWGEMPRLMEAAAARVREIDETASRAPATPDQKKFGDYYATYLDEAAIEAKGTAPIAKDLALVAQVRTPRDLAQAIGRLDRIMAPPQFGQTQSSFPVTLSINIDPKDPTAYIAEIDQSGLGLPDRDYYTNPDPQVAQLRAAYRTYVVAMLHLGRWTDDPARADRIIALEGKIAAAQWDNASIRDRTKTFNPMSPAALAKAAPGFDWATYLTAAGVAGQHRLLIAEPSAMTGFAKLASSVPMETWRDYLALRVIGNAAPVLSKALVEADFAYHGTALSGIPEQRARWKLAVSFTNRAMGDAVGRVYAERWFSPGAKAAMLGMVAQLRTAMAARIDRLDWMAPQTKVRAKRKLANLLIEVGYPDHWRDYSALHIVRGDAYGNYTRAAAFEYDRWVAKLGHPVDRSEWGGTVTPQTVNAFNAGPMVKLVFPAAFLAPPIFDPEADPAVNYGAIGAVIGHEITHSFDDQGAKLDERGMLSDWWTPADVKAFEAATARLADQFSAYEPLPGLHVNGRLTLGETTADLGGLLVALDAYHASLGGKPAPVLNGWSGDQRFFMSAAQWERDVQRPEDLRDQVTNDPHPPSHYRTATVRNIDAWYDAFAVKPGEKLALPQDQRVRIW